MKKNKLSTLLKKLHYLFLYLTFTLLFVNSSYSKTDISFFTKNNTVLEPFNYLQNTIGEDSILNINLNELNLIADSLFSLKLTYGRIGKIKDSLIDIELSQVVLIDDSIHEERIFYKKINYSKFSKVKLNIKYLGYRDIKHNISLTGLSSLVRKLIIPVEKKTLKDKVKEEENAFVFIGTIYEENTKIRLPNVRVIIQDIKDRSKRYVEITGPYGTFRDPVKGYELDSLLLFEVYLKKEGYISKSFIFKEVLTEYGEVDLEEYLKRIRLTKVEVDVEIGAAANLNPIYFDLDKFNIRPDAQVELDKIVSILKEESGLLIELGSHTDSRANDAYNLVLSNRRSKSSLDYIVSKGISAKRLTPVGHGERQLVNRCSNGVVCTDEEHGMNRRTEFRIIGITDLGEKTKNESKRKRPVIKKKDRLVVFIGTITEKGGSNALSKVEVVISNRKTSEVLYKGLTDSRGRFKGKLKKLELGNVLFTDIKLKKKGYVSRSFEFNEILTKYGEVQLNKYLKNLELTKLDLNVEIGKAANLNPIYFDVDKFEIREDAARELDKVVAFLLNEYTLSVEISSHTDSRSEDSYNLILSKKRANEAMRYLVKNGISYGRILQ
ncbi:MAG: OmpA family protein [Flavobacteriales bacterium]|nr:OmpA family protein [Flavobacteriales bacterium]